MHWTEGVVREVLPNGLTVLVQRDPRATVAAVVTHVQAGYFDEPDEWVGISHVVEHMYFMGRAAGGAGAVLVGPRAAEGSAVAGSSLLTARAAHGGRRGRDRARPAGA